MTTEVRGYVQSRVYMDTVVTIQVSDPDFPAVTQRVERAFGWFREVEEHCSRFEASSELRRLCARPGEAAAVSPLLFRCLEFAIAVAEASGGAFDPTVGAAMVRRGFNRSYRSGETSDMGQETGTYRDVKLDPRLMTVMLLRPLLLDLGAVAKGFAIDLAAAELSQEPGFLINAGGDIRAHGLSPEGGPWHIGIKDPNQPSRLLDVIELTDGAICSSGGYERPSPDGGHHLVEPAMGTSPAGIAGVTVAAPTAMAADALSTAAFVMGVDAGIELLERSGVEGRIVTATGLIASTGHWRLCWS
jgi:thiamine biosynthesis lipoprotein